MDFDNFIERMLLFFGAGGSIFCISLILPAVLFFGFLFIVIQIPKVFCEGFEAALNDGRPPSGGRR